jgi:O-methyltransferase
MCLWMDVDLEVSAHDLMVVVVDQLSPEATLFSHEWTADIFQEGAIVTAVHPANTIPPMLARHEGLGRPLTERYIAGYTGAFWPRQGGIVMDTDVLMRLVQELA